MNLTLNDNISVLYSMFIFDEPCRLIVGFSICLSVSHKNTFPCVILNCSQYLKDGHRLWPSFQILIAIDDDSTKCVFLWIMNFIFQCRIIKIHWLKWRAEIRVIGLMMSKRDDMGLLSTSSDMRFWKSFHAQKVLKRSLNEWEYIH